ncbi:unnamed protein product [Rhizoctonia solani]|uniref:Rhamnolipids biosynthesis 3-oxoacyl-[acyl-carrier-protein] reductase n=1 Tax=Rhizoctonia solani TaxID=456999 RepID=A0A8H3E6E8_9AGAM|nr:unnamed protein product [Rhizoctonia solani]
MAHLQLGKVFGVSGLTALVSGGGTGIGLMMAKGLAANGANVYIGGRRKEVVEKAAAAHGEGISGKLLPISLDVTKKESIESAVELISSENDGKLDVLINNAGQVGPVSNFFSIPGSPERRDTETLGKALFKNETFQGWADVWTINVSSWYFLSTACLGLLEKASKAREAETGGWSSSIIGISSISGQMKQAQDHFAYNTSKAAGIHLTKMLSTEFALRKIPVRVNSISPGAFPSEMTSMEGSAFTADNVDLVGKGISKVPSARGGITMAHLQLDKVFGVSGLIVLVSGGGTGIGLMIAKGLAVNGAKVYIGGRRKEVVEKAAAEHGIGIRGKLVPISLDVTNKESIESAVRVVSSENDGKLDILVNNAGQVGPASKFFSDPNAPERKDTETLGTALFRNESFQEWSDLFSINVSSIFFVSTAFLGLLEKASKAREAETGGWSSSIINIASVSGQMKQAQNHFAYNASKAAGIHLTKLLSTELALRKIPIRVNTISPGPFPSEMTRMEGSTFTADNVDLIADGITKVPAARGGLDKDVVGAALYLASPASYFVNGQVITVDGGFLAVNPSVV